MYKYILLFFIAVAHASSDEDRSVACLDHSGISSYLSIGDSSSFSPGKLAREASDPFIAVTSTSANTVELRRLADILSVPAAAIAIDDSGDLDTLLLPPDAEPDAAFPETIEGFADCACNLLSLPSFRSTMINFVTESIHTPYIKIWSEFLCNLSLLRLPNASEPLSQFNTLFLTLKTSGLSQQALTSVLTCNLWIPEDSKDIDPEKLYPEYFVRIHDIFRYLNANKLSTVNFFQRLHDHNNGGYFKKWVDALHEILAAPLEDGGKKVFIEQMGEDYRPSHKGLHPDDTSLSNINKITSCPIFKAIASDLHDVLSLNGVNYSLYFDDPSHIHMTAKRLGDDLFATLHLRGKLHRVCLSPFYHKAERGMTEKTDILRECRTEARSLAVTAVSKLREDLKKNRNKFGQISRATIRFLNVLTHAHNNALKHLELTLNRVFTNKGVSGTIFQVEDLWPRGFGGEVCWIVLRLQTNLPNTLESEIFGDKPHISLFKIEGNNLHTLKYTLREFAERFTLMLADKNTEVKFPTIKVTYNESDFWDIHPNMPLAA